MLRVSGLDETALRRAIKLDEDEIRFYSENNRLEDGVFYAIDHVASMYSLGIDLPSLLSLLHEHMSVYGGALVGIGYRRLLLLSSIAFALGADEAMHRIREASVQFSEKDWVLATVLNGAPIEHPSEVLVKRVHRPLRQLVELDPGERSEALRSYVSDYWYRSNSDQPWYNSHESNGSHGYWVFEAAAIARIYGIDDSALEGADYYPYDLAHFLDLREA